MSLYERISTYHADQDEFFEFFALALQRTNDQYSYDSTYDWTSAHIAHSKREILRKPWREQIRQNDRQPIEDAEVASKSHEQQYEIFILQ